MSSWMRINQNFIRITASEMSGSQTSRRAHIRDCDAGDPKVAPPSPSSSPSISISQDEFKSPEGVTANGISPANLSTSNDGPSGGLFWAGADIGTLMRAEAITGRKYYDYDGVTEKDPVKTLGDAGVNAVRVEGERGQCLGPTTFTNNTSTRGEELTFSYSFGCADIQVKTAQRGIAEGMRVVLTINQGIKIPKELESLSYSEMVTNVRNETKSQLQPFLDAKIVPDIILLENEGTDGFLYTEESTGHVRDGKDSDKELCGQLPTGKMNSYPQYTGYLKAEILAANEAIASAGLSNASVRYGLHSHGQYVQWKEGVVHGDKPPSQTKLSDKSDSPCAEQVIPQDLLDLDIATMLNIAGFSAYPDPMTPTDINNPSSLNATLTRLTETLTQLQDYAEKYGKFASGPFAGQYKLQSLGVEYATSFTADQIPQEVALTEMMWKRVKGFSSCLGMMWWEPWYCYNDWEGGKATLCKTKEDNGEVPTDTMKAWGKAASSPWKAEMGKASNGTVSTA
ncbi:uncharacterized protein KY384_000680 [Bacidia gigantensis]|uniref:uncharacterized protein n=1 Tax=Bacidia gigantensis TaxID=2732470 RepID=UPI001D052A89|nr:uncharacterized protein KY384_000680 [Bacidia gigantensis]KAG8525918.1 hypothetical protein KY384_000680 [Bacidia gigantensis]